MHIVHAYSDNKRHSIVFYCILFYSILNNITQVGVRLFMKYPHGCGLTQAQSQNLSTTVLVLSGYYATIVDIDLKKSPGFNGLTALSLAE